MKMKRLFDEGKERVRNELNIVKILRQLRDLHHFMHTYFTKEELFRNFLHNNHNVIYLDEESDESCSKHPQ
jgi:hypothetical protein